jgi:hypothetical protein
VEEQGEGQHGVGSGGRSAGAARGVEKSGVGQLELRKSAGEGGGVGTERNRVEGAGGRRWGPGCNFSKVQGLHCKARLTFKP